jgi:hypothetical protein
MRRMLPKNGRDSYRQREFIIDINQGLYTMYAK